MTQFNSLNSKPAALLFRVCCVILSLTFLPDTVWSYVLDSHQCEQYCPEPAPETGENAPCSDSSENAEDPGDSYLQPGEYFQVGNNIYGYFIRDLKVPDLREQALEILAPPPKVS